MVPLNPSTVKHRAKEDPRGATFIHFRRLLGYLWPHKKYLIPAMACILIVAGTYSFSIGSVLPVLTVMIQEDGLHGWVDQYVVEKRLGCRIAVQTALGEELPGVPARAAKVVQIKHNSPLRPAGIEAGDILLSVDGQTGLSHVILHELTRPTEHVALRFLTIDGRTRTVEPFQLPPLSMEQRWMMRAASLLPRGYDAPSRWRTLWAVLLVLLVVVVVGNVARVFAEYLTILCNTLAIVDLRKQMYAHVLKLPLSHFSRNTADTMSMFMQDMNDINRGLNNFWQKMVAEPFKAVGVFFVALWIDWHLTLLVIVCAPFLALVFRKLGKKIRRANRKLLIGYGQMLGRLESTLVGMRVVKAYTRENHERKRLFQIDRRVLKQQLKMGLIEAITSPFVEMLGFFAAAGAILYFGNEILFHGVGAEEFMAMLLCLGAIFDPIRKLSAVYPKLQRANAAAGRIFDLIDSENEYQRDADKPALPTFHDSIVFEEVTFTYPETTTPVLRRVSFNMKQGEVIAIVGPNGSGKTTMLSLLPRFFDIDSGRIVIDGHDIRDVTLRSLRSQFSLITQDPVIFADTIAANIAYGKPQATRAEIEAAAKKAFADDFISRIPEGYDSMVGEHGATLSGGQKQRLSIARCILRDAPILIFDEATSQVDPESEFKIHQALDAVLEDRTAFIIAHRHSTISGADRIIVMDDGRIVAIGTHNELITSCPLYKRLYETQFRNAG